MFDQEFVDVKLSDYKGKYVVLFFYPLDFTFVCPTEITAFSDRMDEFKAINTEVLGCSVDSEFSHLAWVQTDRKAGGLGDIAYPLVSDLKKEIAESFGVLSQEDGVALRGLFIIDKEGVVQHSTINNLAFGRNVDETIRTLQALQYVQVRDSSAPRGGATHPLRHAQLSASRARAARAHTSPPRAGADSLLRRRSPDPRRNRTTRTRCAPPAGSPVMLP